MTMAVVLDPPVVVERKVLGSSVGGLPPGAAALSASRSTGVGPSSCSSELRYDGQPLALGKRPNRLVFSHGDLRQKRAGSDLAPATLASQ